MCNVINMFILLTNLLHNLMTRIFFMSMSRYQIRRLSGDKLQLNSKANGNFRIALEHLMANTLQYCHRQTVDLCIITTNIILA